MPDMLLIPVALVYLLVVGLLFAHGINFFYLTYLSLKRQVPAAQPAPDIWPPVTVQLPVYNERYVAERLIEAAAALDYPEGLLEIQVLDDSTDDTVDIIAAQVEKHRSHAIDIVHVRRGERSGFKAGALAHGLEHARGEFIAIFDADFVPEPDFLRKTVPSFTDPGVAFVQTRWGHINRDYSLLTLLQSLAIDAHFIVEQAARSGAGFWFNFNGTAGVWRKEAITDAGGWRSDTLTEDLDLSYRAFLKGWRAAYLRDVVVQAELPVTFSAYRRQQKRWAQGSLDCAIRLVPEIWAQPLSTAGKLEATLHLTGYTVHLLLFALALLYPAIISFSQEYEGLISLFGIAAVFNATAFAPTIFFLAAQQQLGPHWWRRLPGILFLIALGAGMMLNTLRAALNLLGGKNAVFERTPKFGIAGRGERWTGKQYQLRLDPLILFEFGFAGLNAATMVYGFSAGNWVIGVYAGIFAAGLFFVAAISTLQDLAIWRAHRRRI